MRRFRFRLERVERLRLLARREAEAELSVALGRLADRRARRQALERNRDEAESAWSASLSLEQVDGATLATDARRLESLRAAIAGARAVEDEAALQVETARERAVERGREHRVLERLHQKRKQRWEEELAREEQRLLDELHLAARAAASDGPEKRRCEDPCAGS